MIPLLIWAAVAVVITLMYFLGSKAILVGIVALALLGMRAIWTRPKPPR